MYLVKCYHSDMYVLSTVYEGLEEYSCKYFAVRKEKFAIGDKGDGPLVSPSLSLTSNTNHAFVLRVCVCVCRWSGSALSVAMMR